MKNLNNLEFQELSQQEAIEINGGCPWCLAAGVAIVGAFVVGAAVGLAVGISKGIREELDKK
ncbi:MULTISPECIES: Blp family class II bacteriocin [Aquimarina]|uniref:Blp family class II bacteriocin n=1 Tax=Aquimarina TaxID=290174 RepID=UPI0009447ACF|nr:MULTISPECIES: Blp family class II bacteriocin [Aquimarina]